MNLRDLLFRFILNIYVGDKSTMQISIYSIISRAEFPIAQVQVLQNGND